VRRIAALVLCHPLPTPARWPTARWRTPAQPWPLAKHSYPSPRTECLPPARGQHPQVLGHRSWSLSSVISTIPIGTIRRPCLSTASRETHTSGDSTRRKYLPPCSLGNSCPAPPLGETPPTPPAAKHLLTRRRRRRRRGQAARLRQPRDLRGSMSWCTRRSRQEIPAGTVPPAQASREPRRSSNLLL
jgi:hypothetical protein